MVKIQLILTWFSILVNGHAARFFKSPRDLRQGNPLSLLFVIASDFLSRGLHKLCINFQDVEYKIVGGAIISNLAFIDDILIFTKNIYGESIEIIGFLYQI